MSWWGKLEVEEKARRIRASSKGLGRRGITPEQERELWRERIERRQRRMPAREDRDDRER